MDVPQEGPKNEPVKFKQKDARFTDCTQTVVTGVAVFTVDYPMREYLVAEKWYNISRKSKFYEDLKN